AAGDLHVDHTQPDPRARVQGALTVDDPAHRHLPRRRPIVRGPGRPPRYHSGARGLYSAAFPAMSTRLEIPHVAIRSLRTVARHAAHEGVDGTIVALALFLLTLRFLGVWGAVLIGLGWTYAAVVRRLVMGQRVPGILVLAAVTLTARTIIAMVSGSGVVYFLQPTLGTALVARPFLPSMPFA